MVIELRYRIKGNAAGQMSAILTRRVGPRFDNIHKQVAIQLTTTAKKTLESSKEPDRQEETGKRTRYRLTGTLTGHSGRRSAIRAEILGRGSGQRQGRGVAFPDIALLDKRARHWRTIEYGTPFVTMPYGVFTSGLTGAAQPLGGRRAGDVFQTYGEYIRRQGLVGGTIRRRSQRKRVAAARQRRVAPVRVGDRVVPRLKRQGRGRGYEGKFFLNQAWDIVVGLDGRNIADKYAKAIREELGEFRR